MAGSPPPPPPPKKGMSLYENLLGGATISGAPVKYAMKPSGEAGVTAPKKRDAALQFQPIKRPAAQQQQQKKAKPPSSSSAHKFSSSTTTVATMPSASSPEKQGLGSTPLQPTGVQKQTFEDWVGNEDEEYQYENRARPAWKNKKKKKKQGGQASRVWDWDDVYDPTLPNNYSDYKRSDEQMRENGDWKRRLYHKYTLDVKKTQNESVEEQRPANSMFAPPSFGDAPSRPIYDDADDDYYPSTRSGSNARDGDGYTPPVSFAPPSAQDAATGEDAYMRRMRMSGAAPAKASSPIPPPPSQATPPPPPPTKMDLDPEIEAKRAAAAEKIAAFKAKLQKPPPKTDAAPSPPPPAAPAGLMQSASPSVDIPPPPPPPPPAEQTGPTISRAPVRYNVQPPSADEDTEMSDQPNAEPDEDKLRSNRPGQKGFAERLMKKYGWEKGQGLGASGEGITTALVGKAEKRKKLSDVQGGGWAQPKNMGTIVGGKRRKTDAEQQPNPADAASGALSTVVKLEGMLAGLDVQKEIEENNLMQEIGDDMGREYGNVERVFVWREEMGGNGEVFVKFTSATSALRAVNAMEGTTFAGNKVVAKFFEEARFEDGEYA